MSRPLRIEYPDAWYHVMNRGRRGESIFSDRQDREIFVALLREAADLWDVRLSAYCMMGNHYHLLVQTPQGNLSRFMRHVNGVYTQRYNRLHRYDGQLFRGRFKAILVEQENYLLELVRYIHRNPLRAGLVEKLDAYPWSSHPGYLSSSKIWNWLHKDLILGMLSAKGHRRKAYLQFMAMEDSEKLQGLLERKKWPVMLGSEVFVSWVKQTFFEQKKHQQVPESLQLAPERERIFKEVCEAYGIEKKELFHATRGRSNEPRNVAIFLCRTLRNESLIDIGRTFGMTGYSPAGSAIERVKKNISKNKQLRARVENIRQSLMAPEKGQNET